MLFDIISYYCDFISTEAYAATEAGMQVVVSIRPGNAPLTEQELKEFACVQNFNDS